MAKKKVCDSFCKGCVYYDGWYEYNMHCNYILMEGKRRGCDPGKGCTKKVKKSKKRSKPIWID